MRIVIDMQGAQTASRARGIGRYTQNFVTALLTSGAEHEFVLALNFLFRDSIEYIRSEFDGLIDQENIRVWYGLPHYVGDSSHKSPEKAVNEHLRDAFIAGLAPDAVIITSAFEGYRDMAIIGARHYTKHIPTFCIAYDLIPLNHDSIYLEGDPLYKDFYFSALENFAGYDHFFAISDFTAKELNRHLKIPEYLVTTISSATNFTDASEEFGKCLSKELIIEGVRSPYILSFGSPEPHKNTSRLLEAYSLLPAPIRNAYQLVLIGPKDGYWQESCKELLSRNGLPADSLIIVSDIPDPLLKELYINASLFVLASTEEGFGLPALEAMSFGTPVVASNAGSIPEVVSLHSARFDPDDTSSISSRILAVLENEKFCSDLISYGFKQSKEFSWQRVSERALERLSETGSQSGLEFSATESNILTTRLLKNLARMDFLTGGDDLLHTFIASCVERNIYTRHQQTIYVDISELVQRDARTGVQRVTRSVLTQIFELLGDDIQVLPVWADVHTSGYRVASGFLELLRGEQSTKYISNCFVSPKSGDIFLGLDLQHHTTRVQQAYLTELRQSGVFVCFVIYDLLPIQFPDCWPEEHRVHDIHESWLEAVTKFDKVLCISASVAAEVEAWLAGRPTELARPVMIDWFHLGADIENSSPTTGLPERAGVELQKNRASTTFLMVGTLEPRKGHAQVMQTFLDLWRDGVDVRLVIVGKIGWNTDDIMENIKACKLHPDKFLWENEASDEYLQALYESSSCLIAASLGEGFGLPLIEAAQNGLPIIARDIPVFREVAGEHCFYFSGTSKEQLRTSILQWLDLYNKSLHPQSENIPWLTWRQSAEMLLAKLPTLYSDNSLSEMT